MPLNAVGGIALNCAGFNDENTCGDSFAASVGLKFAKAVAGTLSTFHPVSAPASAAAFAMFVGAEFAAGFKACFGKALRCSGLIAAITSAVNALN